MTNPRFDLDPEYEEVVRLWFQCRGTEMSPGHLAEAGGVLDQSAWLLLAFDVVAAHYRKVKPP